MDVSQIPPPVLEVMSHVGKAKYVGDIIDRCDLPDLDVCRILVILFKRGIVQRVDPRATTQTKTAAVPKLSESESESESESAI